MTRGASSLHLNEDNNDPSLYKVCRGGSVNSTSSGKCRGDTTESKPQNPDCKTWPLAAGCPAATLQGRGATWTLNPPRSRRVSLEALNCPFRVRNFLHSLGVLRLACVKARQRPYWDGVGVGIEIPKEREFTRQPCGIFNESVCCAVL